MDSRSSPIGPCVAAAFNSVPMLIEAIEDYLNAHNEDPGPFVWTATVDSILEKVRRGRSRYSK